MSKTSWTCCSGCTHRFCEFCFMGSKYEKKQDEQDENIVCNRCLKMPMCRHLNHPDKSCSKFIIHSTSEEDSKKEEKHSVRMTKDEYYLGIALAVSKRSTCLKRHYGCVIVNDDIIVATGYNGSPRGAENCCDRGSCKRANAERYTSYEQCDAVHAEQNALMAASQWQLKGATLYLACETYGLDTEKSVLWDEDIYGFYEDKNPVPCPLCERILRNSGIVRVVNREGDIKCL